MRGKHTLPVDNTATAGLATLSVAPYGYKKDKALDRKQKMPISKLMWLITLHTMCIDDHTSPKKKKKM